MIDTPLIITLTLNKYKQIKNLISEIKFEPSGPDASIRIVTGFTSHLGAVADAFIGVNSVTTFPKLQTYSWLVNEQQ